MNKDNSFAEIGNFQHNNSLFREYLGSIGETNLSMREDSFNQKSGKKKISKKTTPKNIIPNGQFAWI